jgi:hypothetical protein
LVVSAYSTGIPNVYSGAILFVIEVATCSLLPGTNTYLKRSGYMAKKKIVEKKVEKTDSKIPDCPNCGKDGLYKFGAENGKTWYSCRQCGKKHLL